MATMTVSEVHANMCEVLEHVKRGGEIEITQNGEVVAVRLHPSKLRQRVGMPNTLAVEKLLEDLRQALASRQARSVVYTAYHVHIALLFLRRGDAYGRQQMLKIPEQHREPLSWLLELSEADAAALLGALERSTPTLTPDALVNQVVQHIEYPRRTLSGIIAVLTSLIITREHYNFSKEQLVDDLLSAAKSEKIGPFSSQDVDHDVLRNRLISLLSLESTLGVTSRASDVMMRHKNVFQSARLLSDVRYVFASSESLQPIAGLIIHNLQITSTTDNETISHFVALDSADLRQLQQVIERAVQKEEVLKSVIQASGYFFIPTEAE